MALLLKTPVQDWTGTADQPVPQATQPIHDAEIIEFPITAARPEYLQPELGTAEEFYIADQPFAPQWDWDLRRL